MYRVATGSTVVRVLTILLCVFASYEGAPIFPHLSLLDRRESRSAITALFSPGRIQNEGVSLHNTELVESTNVMLFKTTCQ